jgi:hypothetical protein
MSSRPTPRKNPSPTSELVLLRKLSEEFAQKILMGELGAAFVKFFVDDRAATGLSRRQMRGNTDLLDLAAEKLPQVHTGPCLP